MAVEPTDHQKDSHPQMDAKWPELLRLIGHEVRSPLTPILGYINMLLKESFGPVSEQQRRIIEEIQKSCHRFTAIGQELSKIAELEAGTAKWNTGKLDLRALLADVIANLPPTNHGIVVGLRADTPAPVQGDAKGLKDAFSALIFALRLQVVTSDSLVAVIRSLPHRGGSSIRITLGDAERIDLLESLAPVEMGTFDEWRGGVGLSLPLARRIIEAHGGRLLAPVEDDKSAAFIYFPAV